VETQAVNCKYIHPLQEMNCSISTIEYSLLGDELEVQLLVFGWAFEVMQ
jgi:hypothetical protein